MKSIKLPLFVLFGFLVAELAAHQDRILTLDGTTLVGLPADYGPATFDLASGVLAVGSHRMLLTPYLRAFFPTEGRCNLNITASWYHDRSQLPPYLNVEIFPEGKDFSYTLLFNLETLDLIEAKILVQVSPKYARYFRIDLDDTERLQIKQSIEVIKPSAP